MVLKKFATENGIKKRPDINIWPFFMLSPEFIQAYLGRISTQVGAVSVADEI